MDDASVIDGLREAAAEYDLAAAKSVVERLIDQQQAGSEPLGATTVASAMGLLRRMRAFRLMIQLGDAAIGAGQSEPVVYRHYAQALIELGELTASEAVLLRQIERPDIGPEIDEMRGLLGRAYKQRFANASSSTSPGAAEALRSAIDQYLGVYRENGNTWHGINAVALLARAQRSKVEIENGPDPAEMAQEILAAISSKELAGDATVWEMATAMEAAVALGNIEEAGRWFDRYVKTRTSDQFAAASTLRQLEEIWQIAPKSELGGIVEGLRALAMEEQTGERINVDATVDFHGFEQRSGGLEKTFGEAGAVTVRWWLQAQDRLQAIARIEDESGKPIGTGFLVDGGDLSPEWAGEILMLTNAHVVSSKYADAMLPDDGWANFTLRTDDDRYKVEELLQESQPDDLDFAVLRLASVPEGVQPVPISLRLPVTDQEQRVYIMGHPLGGDLKISIDDNVLIDHDESKVHYRAPTEPGSSGSPVFNRTWKLIALHHAGGDNLQKLNGQEGSYQANEGIALKAINARLTTAKSPTEE